MAGRRWLTAAEAFPSRRFGLCRVCGGAVARWGGTTCSQACRDRVSLSVSPGSQRWAVEKRDHGICARCGCDTQKLARIVAGLLRHARRHRISREGYAVLRMLDIPRGRWPGDLWDMAHIHAVSEGGGIVPGMTVEAIMGNLETLCLWCHRDDTRAMRRNVCHRT